MKRVLLVDGPYEGEIVAVEEKAQRHVIALIRTATAMDVRGLDDDSAEYKAHVHQVEYHLQAITVLGHSVHIGACDLDITTEEIAEAVLSPGARRAWQ